MPIGVGRRPALATALAPDPRVPRTDAKGLAKPCGARTMAAAKHVDASPSTSEGGYSPMTVGGLPQLAGAEKRNARALPFLEQVLRRRRRGIT
jgi:hypothetical protein